MTDDERYLTGHCACGSLRYAIQISTTTPPPYLSAFCHCSRCQRFNAAPFIWTSHWDRSQLTWWPEGAASLPGDEGKYQKGFSTAIQSFEAIEGRKWKLRCRHCGGPMGSWNAAKQRWTVYLPTLLRLPSSTQTSTTPWTHNEGPLSGSLSLSDSPLSTNVLELLSKLPLPSSINSIPNNPRPSLIEQDEGRLWSLIRPTHHQFFGSSQTWGLPFSNPSGRAEADDGLERWSGYKDLSERVLVGATRPGHEGGTQAQGHDT